MFIVLLPLELKVIGITIIRICLGFRRKPLLLNQSFCHTANPLFGKSVVN